MEVSGRRQTYSDNRTTCVYCDICQIVNKTVNAENYCLECNEFFCNGCSSVHKMFKVSKNHKLLSGNEMPRQRLPTEDGPACTEHKGKLLECYCTIHKNFLCTVCVTSEHTNCPIEYIADIALGFETCPQYRSLEENISSLLHQLNDTKKASSRNSKDLQTVYNQFVSDVKTFRSEIDSLLDSMETSILKEAQGIKEFGVKVVQTVSSACDKVTTDVNEIVTNLEKHKQYKQERQFVISAKSAENKLCEYEKKLVKISRQYTIRHYKFHKNEKMLLSLQLMSDLGTLVDTGINRRKLEEERNEKVNTRRANKDHESVRVSHVGQVNMKHSDDESEMAKKEKEKLELVYKRLECFRARYVGQINVRHPEDKFDCGITGSIMVDPHRIVVTDFYNDSVKLINVDSEIILSYLKLSSLPWDVTCIDKSQLVITCNNKLVFVNIGQTLTVNKELQVNGVCKGICFNDNQLLVSFVQPEPAVKLISLHGEIIKTFSTDQNGKPLFKLPWYICLSDSTSTVYVSDWKTHSVTSLDLQGRVQNIYRHTNLESPLKITADNYGSIYIAGRDSHNIHQISTRCRPIQILLDQTQGMECPWSLTYCETDKRLYVSHAVVPKSNYLSVYQLY